MGTRSEPVADAFWHSAGGRNLFGRPAAVERAAPRALPVAIHRVPGLHTGDVRALLDRIGADPWIDAAPRALCGCLIADAGAALILVDRNDPDDEQRMTIAHETAHLLLHYLKPRKEALTAFGPAVLAVLDRTRPPTPGEQFASALRDVPIEPFRHAMARSKAGLAEPIAQMEEEADDLAVELLAPWQELKSLGTPSAGLIAEQFGVPRTVAARLASMIGAPRTRLGVVGLFEKKSKCRRSRGSLEQ
jgi:hypothetical protein